MANPYCNKIIINGEAKIDLTGDTVDAAHLAEGYTAHDASGAVITGVMTAGGGDLPDPITAGDTPVFADVTYQSTSSSAETAAQTFTCRKAGAYRLKAVFNATYSSCTAGIYVNGAAAAAASWEGSGSHLYDTIITDQALAAGDVVEVRIKGAGLSSRVTTCRGLIVCINWETGL